MKAIPQSATRELTSQDKLASRVRLRAGPSRCSGRARGRRMQSSERGRASHRRAWLHTTPYLTQLRRCWRRSRPRTDQDPRAASRMRPWCRARCACTSRRARIRGRWKNCMSCVGLGHARATMILPRRPSSDGSQSTRSCLEDAHPPMRPVALPTAREMAGVKPRKVLAEVCALGFG